MARASDTPQPPGGDGPPAFTHLDAAGRVRMVDVSDKASTLREAVAEALITMKAETFAMILEGRASKGNVLETARIAGIQGAKRTAELIPMCHPLLLTHVAVDFSPAGGTANAFRITATVRTHGPTGVEMEALTAASLAALTIYDMCKAVDREMVIDGLCLQHKSGGKSGRYDRRSATPAAS